MHNQAVIKPLPTLLANQIAAGEVVERPASVVKELVENSIDAGANRIDIDIELGGSRSIRILDDGYGIDKDQLSLAVQPHATSKIETTEDLAAITSLGFRGEALASISSVSRFKIVSKHQLADIAWQLTCEGNHQQLSTSPAALKQGTLIEVNDLFFNTPARRKFLRNPKTEFAHIEDVVRRLALSSPHVAMTLRHNNKTIRRYHSAEHNAAMERRIAQAIEQKFVQSCLFVERDFENIRFKAWLATPEYSRSQNDGQFIFINGRLVKDRTLTHAAKQGYQQLLAEGRQPAYVIFLELEPTEVDVNVHPTKHEVRFSQPRLIHDLMVSCIHQSLVEYLSSTIGQHNSVGGISIATDASHESEFYHADGYHHPQRHDSEVRTESVTNITDYKQVQTFDRPTNFPAAEKSALYQFYKPLSDNHSSEKNLNESHCPLGRYVMTMENLVVFSQSENLVVCKAGDLAAEIFHQWCKQSEPATKPLLMPISTRLRSPFPEGAKQRIESIGFKISLKHYSQLVLLAIPTMFAQQQGVNWLEVIDGLTNCSSTEQMWLMFKDVIGFQSNWLSQEWFDASTLSDIPHRTISQEQLIEHFPIGN